MTKSIRVGVGVEVDIRVERIHGSNHVLARLRPKHSGIIPDPDDRIRIGRPGMLSNPLDQVKFSRHFQHQTQPYRPPRPAAIAARPGPARR